MHYVYILKSKKDDKLYYGSTNDLRRRLAEHNDGKSLSTKGRRPFELCYYEAYAEEEDARTREYQLKQNGRALARLRLRLKKSLQ